MSPSPELIASQLEAVARRLIPRVFEPHFSQGPIEAPELYALVQRLDPAAWETDPTDALRDAIDQAARKLPGEVIEDAASLTYRQAALWLFGLDPLDLEYQGGKGYDNIRKRVFESDERLQYSASGKRKKIASDIRLLIAKQLLKRDPETAGQQTQTSAEEAAESTSSEFEIEAVLIDRDEYLSRLRGHLDTGYRIICIWGEPGTGKTILAEQFAAQLDGINPVLTIRMTPTPEASTADSLVFRQDLDEALIAEGLEPTNWNLEYRLSKFRARIAEGPRAKAVILDNVEREELVWQLIPAQPKIPVIITMRVKPQGDTIACEELHDFTESQASEFINRHLADQNERETVALARVLGCRPLALDHAVRFVKVASGYSVRDLTHDLRLQVADTLAGVAPPKEREQQRTIAKLYKIILASLLEDEPAQAVLDAFLAVAGQSGITLRELIYIFMQSDQGGSHNRLYFLTGLHALTRRGLLRAHDRKMPSTLQPDAQESALAAELSMHALTYLILRDLSGMKPFQIEARYLDFIRTSKRAASEDDISTDARIRAWALNGFTALAQDGLPDGWLSCTMLDPRTFIVTKEPEADDDPREPYTVRYAIEADGLYKLDYRTGQWSEPGAEESQKLRLSALVYRERARSKFIPLMPGSPPASEPNVPAIQFDREVTPPDGLGHVPISQVPDKYLIRYGVSVRLLCGKLSVPTTASSGGGCQDCLRVGNSPEWLRGIEVALQDAFSQLSVKRPLYSAQLFLTRAWLSRSLKRPNESILDLMYAYDFLSKATETSRYEHLFAGLEIVMMAKSIPDDLQGWLIAVHEHLMALMADAEPSEPAMLFLRHIRSQSLQQLGLDANALIELNEIVALVDSGAADHKDMDVDLGKIFWEKQDIERRLGRFDERDAT